MSALTEALRLRDEAHASLNLVDLRATVETLTAMVEFEDATDAPLMVAHVEQATGYKRGSMAGALRTLLDTALARHALETDAGLTYVGLGLLAGQTERQVRWAASKGAMGLTLKREMRTGLKGARISSARARKYLEGLAK